MTMTRTRSIHAFVLIAWLAFLAPAAARDETLARAKDLYLAAAYDEALAILDNLRAGAGGASEIAQYRVFCLLALNRRDEAKSAIEGIVSADPFYRPSEAQTSPRIRSVFDEIRRSVLPSVVQRAYAEAKDAFDRKDLQATAQFDRVLALLDDPDVRGISAFADLRTVASGFRDLSSVVAANAPAGNAAPKAATPAAAGGTAPSAVAAIRSKTAREGDVGVSPPETLFQRLPRWRPFRDADRLTEFKGTIEVTIDEQGNVAAAVIRRSVHPTYDSELLSLAKSWKYKPATRDGVPIRFVKLVEVQLRPPTS